MINPITKIKLIDEYEINPTFNRVMGKNAVNLSNLFWADLYQRLNNKNMNNFFTIFIFGEQGTFKSGIGLDIAQKLSINGFNITFSDEQLRNAVKHSEPGEIFIRDETQKTYGIGSEQLISNIENFVYQLRERQNSFIFICPENIAPAGFHYYLRTLFVIEELKLVKCAVINPKTNNYLGYIWFDLRESWDNEIWKQYKGMKNKFLNQVISNDYDKFSIEEYAEELLSKESFNLDDYRDNKGIIIPQFIKNYVYQNSGNLTNDLMKMVYNHIIQKFVKDGEQVRGFLRK